jgi:uncharacterized protein YndB with AHSA1/START domain
MPDGDRISIRRILNAPRRRVFEAWTRPDLMTRWLSPGRDWMRTGTADVKVGGRVDEMSPNQRVRWTCVGHDDPSWVGTWLDWRLAGTGDAVIVSLQHGGWKEAAPDAVAQGWRHFMGSLKAHLETGTGQPW